METVSLLFTGQECHTLVKNGIAPLRHGESSSLLVLQDVVMLSIPEQYICIEFEPMSPSVINWKICILH